MVRRNGWVIVIILSTAVALAFGHPAVVYLVLPRSPRQLARSVLRLFPEAEDLDQALQAHAHDPESWFAYAEMMPALPQVRMLRGEWVDWNALGFQHPRPRAPGHAPRFSEDEAYRQAIALAPESVVYGLRYALWHLGQAGRRGQVTPPPEDAAPAAS